MTMRRGKHQGRAPTSAAAGGPTANAPLPTEPHATPMEGESKAGLLSIASEIVAAYLQGNPVPVQQIPSLIHSVLDTLDHAHQPAAKDPRRTSPQPRPAVPRGKSVHADGIVCLEDGLSFKMLKRHLRTSHGLTPEQYRAKWELDPDYPMTAPGYVERRSQLAKALGFGRTDHARRGGRRRKPKTSE